MGLIILGIVLGLLAAGGYVVSVVASNNSYLNRTQPNKPIKMGVAIALFIVPVVLFTAISATTRVGTGQIAVMTRFGKVTGQEFGEGLHLKNPLDKANIYNIQVQKIDADAAAASKDLQDVNTKVAINYNVEAGQVSEIHKAVGELYQQKLIDPAIQEVFKGATSRYDATQLITERQGVKAYAYDALKARLAPYGINVRDLSILDFTFSPEFTKAIEAKQVAQQDAQRAVFVAERAKQEAQADIERARGQAESQRLLTETASADSIELKRLEVQQSAINKWNGVLPTTQAGAGTDFLFNVKQ